MTNKETKIIEILDNLPRLPRGVTSEQIATQILSLFPDKNAVVKMLEGEKDIPSCHQEENPQCSRCYEAKIKNRTIDIAIKIIKGE